MAVSKNISTVSVEGGGSSTPLWKKLGYSSYQDYINATSGANGGKSATSVSLPGLGKYTPSVGSGLVNNGGLVKPPSVGQLNPGLINPGLVGGIGGGSVGGGVTKEGVITGTPGLEKMPTINNGSSSPSTGKTGGSLSNYYPASGASSAGATGGQNTAPAEEVDDGEFRAKYQGGDFLEWYKANYGTDFDPSMGFSRGNGMSDVDWAIGQNLYNSYLTGRNLEDSYNSNRAEVESRYGSAIESLDTSKRNAQQSASITLDKLKKYLPTQIKAQGLGGLGVSESSMLQAYTNYNNAMGEIEGNYNANKSTLDANQNTTLSELQRAYQDSKTNLDISAGEQSQNIFDKYYQADKNAKDATFGDAYSTIAGSTSTSADELLKYVEQFKGKVSKEQYNTLQQQAQQIAKSNAEKKAELDRQQAYQAIVNNIDYMLTDPGNFNDDGSRLTEDGKNRMLQYLEQNRGALGEQTYNAYKSQIESMNVYTAADKAADEKATQAEKDKRIVTGQEAIEYGGNYYQCQSKLDHSANQIKRNNDFKDQLKKLGFTDPFDPNIPNGTTIKSKVDNKGSNDFNFWDDIGAFLFSPLGAGAWDSWANSNEIYMTYYNGEWYLSKKV